LSILYRFSRRGVVTALFASLTLSFRSRAALQLEILALRHQLIVLQRSVKRPKLTTADRLLWAWLCHIWSEWRSALVIVRPEPSSRGIAMSSGCSGRGRAVMAGQDDQPFRTTSAS
jgi:hypothetical protein